MQQPHLCAAAGVERTKKGVPAYSPWGTPAKLSSNSATLAGF